MGRVAKYVYEDEFGNTIDCGYYAQGVIYDDTYRTSLICLNNKVPGVQLHHGTRARAKMDGYPIEVVCTEIIYDVKGYGDNVTLEEKLNEGVVEIEDLRYSQDYTIENKKQFYSYANRQLKSVE